MRKAFVSRQLGGILLAIVVAAVGEAAAMEPSDLLGLWKHPRGFRVELRTVDGGEIRGVLVEVPEAERVKGYREGDTVIHQVRVVDDRVKFETTVRPDRPEMLTYCEPERVVFTGTVSPDLTTIEGTIPQYVYAGIPDDNGHIVSCKLYPRDETIPVRYDRVVTPVMGMARILPELGAPTGQPQLRLIYEQEGVTSSGTGARLERVLVLRPELAWDGPHIQLRIGSDIATITDRPPPGDVDAASWHLRQRDYDEAAEIVRGVRLFVNGVVAVPSSSAGTMAATYVQPDQDEDAQLHLELDVDFFGTTATIDLPLDASEPRALQLRNPLVRGFGMQPVPPPPAAPLSAELTAGRFLVHVPQRWFESAGTRLDIFLDERADGRWRRIEQRLRQPLPRGPVPFARFDLDDLFGILSLRGEAYRVRFEVYQAGADAVSHQFTTPVMTREEITAALQQRVNDVARRLLGTSYYEWRAQRDEDASAAQHGLWKALTQSRAFSVAVDVVNLSGQPFEFRREVVVTGVFTDRRREYGRVRVRLGTHEAGDTLAIPPLSAATVQFPPFLLSPYPREHDELLGKLRGFDIHAQPTAAAADGLERIFVPLGAYAGHTEPCVQLATAMVQHTPGLARGDRSVDEYARALDKVFASERVEESAKQVYRQCRVWLEGLYAELERRAHLLDDRLGDEGTGLGSLEACVNQLMARGYRVRVGLRRGSGPAISAGAYAGWGRECDIELSNTWWRRGWSALGAALNPELSFTLDAEALRLISAAAPENVAADEPRRHGIPGVHRWRLSEAIAYDEDRVLRRVFNNPVMADALARYTEELRQLSPELERKIRTRELEQVKGQLHEELGGLQARSADLEAVRRAHPRYASRIVFVPGRHIVGPSFDSTNARQELSDGFYVANVNEKMHVFGIEEEKAGTSSASKVVKQAVNDVLRLKAFGFTLQNLPRELQNALRLGHHTVEIPADRLVVNFEDPGLFKIRVPRDSHVPEQAGRGIIRAQNQRAAQHGVQFTDAERGALEAALRTAHRAEYTEWELQDLAIALARHLGTRLLAWDARDVTRDELEVILRARRPNLTSAELDRAFAEGLRIREVGGEFEPVFKEWERPIISRDEYRDAGVREYRRRFGREPSRNVVEKMLQRFDKGVQRDPAMWDRNVAESKGAEQAVINGTWPVELLSHEEFMLWYRRSGMAQRFPYAEETIRQARARGEVLDTTTGKFRPATDTERGEVGWSIPQGGKRRSEYRRWYHKLWTRAQQAAPGAEGFAAAGRGLIEHGRLGEERLRVTVLSQARTAVLDVLLVTHDGPMPLEPHQQRRLLQHWYRNARHAFGQGDLPTWLRD